MKKEMKTVCFSFLLFAVLFSVSIVSAGNDSYLWTSDEPSDDAWIQNENTTDNHGDSVVLNVQNDLIANESENISIIKKTFVNFDLPEDILNAATIHSATLRLYIHDAPQVDSIHHVRRVDGEWNEGGITWDNQPNTSSITDSQLINGSENAWIEWDVTADIAAFVNGTYTNYGWMIEDPFPAEEDTFASYRSKEYSNETVSPTLVVNYSVEGNETDDPLVNIEDLIYLLTNWGECEDCMFDFNNDDMIDESDLNILLALWGIEFDEDLFLLNSPDINDDGYVNMIDLSILLSSWGECDGDASPAEGSECPADLYADGIVDGLDLQILLAFWTFDGPEPPASFNVTLHEPIGTYDVQTDLPITFTINGTGNFSCWYDVETIDGNNTINATTIPNCDATTFNVPEDDEYIFTLFVLNEDNDTVVSDSTFIVNTTDFDTGGNGDTGGGGGGSSSSSGGGGGSSCLTGYICEPWGECADGEQTRECSKGKPHCVAPGDMPETARGCISEGTFTETISDAEPNNSFNRLTGAVIGPNGRPTALGIIWLLILLLLGYFIVAAARSEQTTTVTQAQSTATAQKAAGSATAAKAATKGSIVKNKAGKKPISRSKSSSVKK